MTILIMTVKIKDCCAFFSFLCNAVRSLPPSIKRIDTTAVVIWRCLNKSEWNRTKNFTCATNPLMLPLLYFDYLCSIVSLFIHAFFWTFLCNLYGLHVLKMYLQVMKFANEYF